MVFAKISNVIENFFYEISTEISMNFLSEFSRFSGASDSEPQAELTHVVCLAARCVSVCLCVCVCVGPVPKCLLVRR